MLANKCVGLCLSWGCVISPGLALAKAAICCCQSGFLKRKWKAALCSAGGPGGMKTLGRRPVVGTAANTADLTATRRFGGRGRRGIEDEGWSRWVAGFKAGGRTGSVSGVGRGVGGRVIYYRSMWEVRGVDCSSQ